MHYPTLLDSQCIMNGKVCYQFEGRKKHSTYLEGLFMSPASNNTYTYVLGTWKAEPKRVTTCEKTFTVNVVSILRKRVVVFVRAELLPCRFRSDLAMRKNIW